MYKTPDMRGTCYVMREKIGNSPRDLDEELVLLGWYRRLDCRSIPWRSHQWRLWSKPAHSTWAAFLLRPAKPSLGEDVYVSRRTPAGLPTASVPWTSHSGNSELRSFPILKNKPSRFNPAMTFFQATFLLYYFRENLPSITASLDTPLPATFMVIAEVGNFLTGTFEPGSLTTIGRIPVDGDVISTARPLSLDKRDCRFTVSPVGRTTSVIRPSSL